jgi:hypothetical protein
VLNSFFLRRISSFRSDLLEKTLLLLISLWSISCAPEQKWNDTLPNTRDIATDLTLNRSRVTPGYHHYSVARTSIHMHSYLSYDSCTEIDPAKCKSDLRSALCKNQIDFVALTDHPNHMAENEFSTLLLQSPGDTPITENGNLIGNQLNCPDSHSVLITAGFENELMPIGMSRHLTDNLAQRETLYTKRTPDIVSRLKKETHALVMMPHTETKSKDIELLSQLNLDGIEIYNLHANVNPQMRAHDLGFTYFNGLIDILVYWIDPSGQQEPDLAFLSFLKVSDVYARKWNGLIAKGHHVAGVGGNDAHQSLFPGTARDKDKIDSYRRLSRWVTNHFLIKQKSISEIKDAIRSARGWVVFEGLGTPKNFEFYAQNSVQNADLGESLPLIKDSTNLSIQLPRLHPSSPQSGANPLISVNLIRVDPQGNETIVLSSEEPTINYPVQAPGAYRVEVMITPHHLKNYIGYRKNITDYPFKWIISNHIYIAP